MSIDSQVYDTREKKDEESLIAEIKERFRYSCNAEQVNRSEGLDDLRFKNGEQWPAEIKKQREEDFRPCLVMNDLPGFSDQIIGDSRLNKISIKVSPNGGGATEELAQTINGLIRNIEQESNADQTYDYSLQQAVDSSFGYFRVTKDYEDDEVFDQVLKIKRIKNQFTVYFDPMAQEPDGRDARYVIVSEKIPRKEFELRYPGKSPAEFQAGQGTNDDDEWSDENQVRVAEYWVKHPVNKKLYLMDNGEVYDSEKWEKVKDELQEQEQVVHVRLNPDGTPIVDQTTGQPQIFDGPSPDGNPQAEKVINPTPKIVKERKIKSHKIVQYLVDGTQILDGPVDWPGKFIPIIPVWGKELVIDGKTYRRSIIRNAKDPQRMMNYYWSAAAERVALSPKAPFIIGEGQVKGHEEAWGSANSKNLPYLPYNDKDNRNLPQRNALSSIPQGEIQLLALAKDEKKSATSMFDASLGARSNETSGIAIRERKQEGDVANFEFHDNKVRAVSFCGEILVDLIPKTYDAERVITILNEDGTNKSEVINKKIFDTETETEVVLNDLSVGKYKVTVGVGPQVTTQRQETLNSLIELADKVPVIGQVGADMIVNNLDFIGKDELVKRVKAALGIQEEGEEQPPQGQEPDLDQVDKALTVKGKELLNIRREQEIQQNDLQTNQQVAEVVQAATVLRQLGLI